MRIRGQGEGMSRGGEQEELYVNVAGRNGHPLQLVRLHTQLEPALFLRC